MVNGARSSTSDKYRRGSGHRVDRAGGRKMLEGRARSLGGRIEWGEAGFVLHTEHSGGGNL